MMLMCHVNIIIAVDTIPSAVECDESFVPPLHDVIHEYEANDQASLVPRLFAGEGKEEPGTHRSRMRLITVTFHGFRILSAYSCIR